MLSAKCLLATINLVKQFKLATTEAGSPNSTVWSINDLQGAEYTEDAFGLASHDAHEEVNV